MASLPLSNSDDFVISVSIGFPSNSERDTLFHHTTCVYSHGDWNGICDHVRDVPLENMFKFGASAGCTEFCEVVQVGIDVMYPSS